MQVATDSNSRGSPDMVDLKSVDAKVNSRIPHIEAKVKKVNTFRE